MSSEAARHVTVCSYTYLLDRSLDLVGGQTKRVERGIGVVGVCFFLSVTILPRKISSYLSLQETMIMFVQKN